MEKRENKTSLQYTSEVESIIRAFDIDLYGITEVRKLTGIPMGININRDEFFEKFPYAIVLGVQWRKFGDNISSEYIDLFLEKAALKIFGFLLEEEGYNAVTIHPEDEFGPERFGFISLKVLAKAAGLGWQGRSLLTVSPKYGPLHRLIAVLTDMPLEVSSPVENQCGSCTECIDQCPVNALTVVEFEDHPEKREDVLDITTCIGDNPCTVCIETCPFCIQRCYL